MVTLDDVLSQFRYDTRDLPTLVAAYCTVQIDPERKIHVWTLLEHRNEAIERQLASAERHLLETFPQLRFDFTTIHLSGRDPAQFIPDGAIEVAVRQSSPPLPFTYTRRHLVA